MRIPGVKASLAAFFCYCALETTMGLWTSTYLSEVKGVDLILATKCGMLFYIGIATGRLVSGMISEWLGDKQLIYTGTAITMLSLFALTLLPSNGPMLYLLIVLAGIGCGPIYPGMVHHSPEISGPEGSQMLIGFQLALSSAGSIMVPALFGIIVNNLSVALMPGFCMIFAFIMLIMVLNSVRS
jgi:fucose permease